MTINNPTMEMVRAEVAAASREYETGVMGPAAIGLANKVNIAPGTVLMALTGGEYSKGVAPSDCPEEARSRVDEIVDIERLVGTLGMPYEFAGKLGGLIRTTIAYPEVWKTSKVPGR